MTQVMNPQLARPQRIAYVEALWHHEIVEQSRQGFVQEWERMDPQGMALELFTVPGALELPLMSQRLARTGRYDAVVCAALVVDGGIYRHEFVATAVIDGLMKVQLAEDLPVFSAVLTPHQFHGHSVQHSFFHGHFFEKGGEVARACRHQVVQLEAVRQLAAGARA